MPTRKTKPEPNAARPAVQDTSEHEHEHEHERRRDRGRVEPLGAERYKLQLTISADTAGAARPARDSELEAKLVRGLTGLGFTRACADATVNALCAGRGPVPWDSPIEVLLRAAVQMATE